MLGSVHHVHGFVKGGVGVRASPPRPRPSFCMAGIISALEMRASVETMCSQEVGDALDVVRFIQGTCIDAADAELALWPAFADEVGQPVGELSLISQ